VSLARVHELVRDEAAGAVSLLKGDGRTTAVHQPRGAAAHRLRDHRDRPAGRVPLRQLRADVGVVRRGGHHGAHELVVIGVGPRTLGRQKAYSIALATALPLQVISWLLMPISRLLVVLGNALTPGRGFRNGPFASEIELREVVDLAQQRGVVAADERKMIQSVFELGDTPAREVMVPRTEMIWIESDKSPAQAMTLAVRSGHSRIPVIGENVDDIVGVVYLKDLVQQTFYAADGPRDLTVAQVMRPAVFVPDSKPLDALLREMQRDRNQHGVAGR